MDGNGLQRHQHRRVQEIHVEQQQQNQPLQKQINEHSEMLSNYIDYTRQFMLAGPVAMNSLVHVPEKTLLVSEFKNKDLKLTAQKRAEKKLNKRSRIHQKNVNADLIQKAEDDFSAAGLSILLRDYAKEGFEYDGEQDLFDMAAFMSTNKEANDTLISLFQREDKTAFIDMVVQRLFTISIGGIRLDNDLEMAKNAHLLEMLTRQVEVFDRLSEENDYMNSLNDDMKEKVELKVAQLRSVANYYQARKEIISDPYYKSHYNEELTLDFTSAKTPEQQKLALKLLKSYAAGREMMEQNGVDSDIIKKMGVPKFADKKKGEDKLKSFLKAYKNESTQKEVLADATKQRMQSGAAKDYLSSIRRHTGDKQIAKELSEIAVKNAKQYKGSKLVSPDYKEPEYSEKAMKQYLAELEKTKVTQYSFASYPTLIRDYVKNHELFERVAFLHRQICRGLAKGYKIDDKTLLSIRAKTLTFMIMDATAGVVNKEVLDNSEFATLSDEEIKERVASAIRNGWGSGALKLAGDMTGMVGDPMAIYSVIDKLVKEEDRTKDATISETLKFAGKVEDGERVSPDELKKRRREYNKNAVMHDFTIGYYSQKHFCGTSHIVDRALTKQERERAEREHDTIRDIKYPRQWNAYISMLSYEETEKLHKLATSKEPADLYKYYTTLLKESFRFKPKELLMTDASLLFEDYDRKAKSTTLIGDNVMNLGESLRKLIEKDWADRETAKAQGREIPGEPLPVPEGFRSLNELSHDTTFMHLFGTEFFAASLSTLGQMHDTKYHHTFSLEETLNHKDSDFVAQKEREDELRLEYEDTPCFDAVSDYMTRAAFIVSPDMFDTTISEWEIYKRHHYTPKEVAENFYELKLREENHIENREKSKEAAKAYRQEQKEENKKAAKSIWDFKNKHQEEISELAQKNPALAKSPDYRQARAITYSMKLLSSLDKNMEPVDPELMLSTLCSKDEKKRSAKINILNKVFDIIMNYDLRQLEFDDYKDLLNPDIIGKTAFVDMSWDLSDSLIKYYGEAKESGEKSCKYSKAQLEELKQKRDFMRKVRPLYDTLYEVMGTDHPQVKDVDVFRMIEEKPDDILDSMSKKAAAHELDGDGQALYVKLAGVAATKHESHIYPGCNMNATFEAFKKELRDQR